MGGCLGVAPNTRSVVVKDNTFQEVKPGSPKSLEGRNSVITYPNGACEESTGIYAKSRCQWSGHLIKIIA